MAGIGIENLLAKIKAGRPDADLNMVRLAFDYANEAHAGQKRMSGEPYIVHPVRAAEILAEMKLPVPLIVAALLHDVPEDTEVTIADIRRDFGDDVASMVAGITKLGKIKYRGIERYIENLRKMFVAMASDLRVILIKFADRIHNLETLSSLPQHKRARVALESLEIYAPIAHRLGMGEIKAKLEDLAFRYVLPKEYDRVQKALAQSLPRKKNYIDRVSKLLRDDLKKADIPYLAMSGRPKHLYSLYRKLQKYENDISKIHDLIALRVVVPSLSDCYAVLGTIHQRWKPLKGRIKDYISQPKPNGYQSLHTTVFCEDGEIVEFQIRTQEMHEAAELGIAAHWQYDEAGKKATAAAKKELAWVRELAEWHQETNEDNKSMESLESLKIDVFQNRIFVFTPNGDVIDLPEGATPVDFAYAIHTDVGNTCVGARINDQIVALETKLSSGDYCEIITDKNRKGPSPDWLNFVKTSGARSQIRSRAKSKIAEWLKDTAPGEQPKKTKK